MCSDALAGFLCSREGIEMDCYPVAALLKKGTRLVHVEHGACRVVKTKKRDPHTVWVRMESDGIEGTVDVRLLRWPSGESRDGMA